MPHSKAVNVSYAPKTTSNQPITQPVTRKSPNAQSKQMTDVLNVRPISTQEPLKKYVSPTSNPVKFILMTFVQNVSPITILPTTISIAIKILPTVPSILMTYVKLVMMNIMPRVMVQLVS